MTNANTTQAHVAQADALALISGGERDHEHSYPDTSRVLTGDCCYDVSDSGVEVYDFRTDECSSTTYEALVAEFAECDVEWDDAEFTAFLAEYVPGLTDETYEVAAGWFEERVAEGVDPLQAARELAEWADE